MQHTITFTTSVHHPTWQVEESVTHQLRWEEGHGYDKPQTTDCHMELWETLHSLAVMSHAIVRRKADSIMRTTYKRDLQSWDLGRTHPLREEGERQLKPHVIWETQLQSSFTHSPVVFMRSQSASGRNSVSVTAYVHYSVTLGVSVVLTHCSGRRGNSNTSHGNHFHIREGRRGHTHLWWSMWSNGGEISWR